MLRILLVVLLVTGPMLADDTWKPDSCDCPACAKAWPETHSPAGTFVVPYPEGADAKVEADARCEAVAGPFRAAGLEVKTSPGGQRGTERKDTWTGREGRCRPDLLILDSQGTVIACGEVETSHERALRGKGCSAALPCRDSGNCTLCQWRRYAQLPGDKGGPDPLPFHLVVPVEKLDKVRELLKEVGIADKVVVWTWKAKE